MDHRLPPPASTITFPPRSSPVLRTASSTHSNHNHSNVFRPRRSDDWHEYREIIEQLYRNDQLKLRDVKRIMERDYKFYASEKQYKDRLAAWHIRKNIKAKEVEIMLRKQQKRAARGKQTAFRVNGQDVDPKRIARFVRRYGSTWDHDREKEAEEPSPEPGGARASSPGTHLAYQQIETPSDMTCYTPEPTEESATSVSPLSDLRSPSHDMAYPHTYDPNQIDSLPDLIIDDDHNLPPMMHPNQTRRPYNYHPPAPTYVPPVSVPASVPAPVGDDIDADGEDDSHPDEWNQLEAFQSRLQGLSQTLDLTMAKWANGQDLLQDAGQHEGSGM